MSTGAECYFTEDATGQWTLHLQEYPYGANEDFETYGPFSTFRRADDYLRDNFANPGGYSMNLHPNHVHDYHVVTEYGERQSRCKGCDKQEPKFLDCGKCEDYHREHCDEYELHISFRITVARAADYLAGEKTIHESVERVVESQIEYANKRRQDFMESARRYAENA